MIIMDKSKKKILEAMDSDDFEEKLKEEGFDFYTTESGEKKKKKANLQFKYTQLMVTTCKC